MLIQLFAVACVLFASRTSASIHLAHRTVDVDRENGLHKRSEVPKLDPGTYVFQFVNPIDQALIRRLRLAIGYEPRDFVPINSLVIYVSSSSVAQLLVTQFVAQGQITHIEPLRPVDRHSDIAQSVSRIGGSSAALAKAAKPTPSADGLNSVGRHGSIQTKPTVTQNQTHVRLRVRSFLGSSAPAQDSMSVQKYHQERFAKALKDCGTTPRISVDINRGATIVDDVQVDEAEMAADALVHDFPDVYWVEVAPNFETLNKWAASSVQRASDGEASVGRSASWQPLLGLSGENQIVSLADTGIAVDTCFFTDGKGGKALPWPRVSSLAANVPDLGHPKIRAYWSGVGGDFADAFPAGSHGTHTAGSLAGRSAAGSASSQFDGGAPNARIVFIDLQSASNPSLSVPDDIGSTLFRFAINHKAKLQSNSWGAALGGIYGLDEGSVDRAIYDNPQFLALFAAGNGGPIVSPAMAKNAFTVGATMNGVETVASEQVPSRPAADYTAQWAASYSSKGSSSHPFEKPDGMAPGGPWIGSASNESPLSGSCTNLKQTTLKMAGTSMATPTAAASAALIYEAFEKDDAAAPLNQSLIDYGGGLPVYSSLVRSMLAASGIDLLGVYPRQVYSSAVDRRYSSGNGRIALDRVLGPSVSLVVLSNEKASAAVTRATPTVRACVSIDGLLATDVLADHELVLQLGYNDYPSSPVAAATIINDLDLRVSIIGKTTFESVNGKAAGVRETRSTLERVIIRPARAVDVQVVATSLGFGTSQKFSLIAVLRRTTFGNGLIAKKLVTTPLGFDSGVCTACKPTLPVLAPANQCLRCGNGKIEAPAEQCEPSINGVDCCNEKTCQWRATGTLCAITVGSCLLRGKCSSAAKGPSVCITDTAQTYSISSIDTKATICTPTDGVPLPTACVRSSQSWLRELRVVGLSADIKAAENPELRICCTPFDAVAAMASPPEPSYFELASEYMASRLNIAKIGVFTTADVLVTMRDAKLLLEGHCGTFGFIDAADRRQAAALVQKLKKLFNENANVACTPEQDPMSGVLEPNWCTVTSAPLALTDLLCSGAPNRYDEIDNQCQCGPLRFQGEPDCANLACSAHGASVYDYDKGEQVCVCLPGWEGPACDKCQAPDADAKVEIICVGATNDLVTAGSPFHYFRQAVASDTATSRLSGVYYSNLAAKLGKSAPHKMDDRLPGTDGLDCWCRETTTAEGVSSFATLYDALEAARASQQQQEVWWSRLDAQLHQFAPNAPVKKALATSNRVGLLTAAIIGVAALMN